MVRTGVVLVRVVGVLIGASAMMVGAAHASSFVVAQPPTEKVSKSFVYVGLPAPSYDRRAETRNADTPPSLPVASAIARSTATAFRRQAKAAAPPVENAGASTTQIPLAFPLPDISGPTIRKVSPSIIAFDESFPAVAFEKVAAISVGKPKTSQRRPETVAMLIRGGIVDSGIPGSAAPVVAISAPASPGASAAKNGAANRGNGGGKKPEPEEPVKIAPPPPPPNLPRLRGPE